MNDDIIRKKAKTLIEALPYMRRFQGATLVIKYGGHAMGSAELAEDFARDIVLLKQVGMNPVVVHGGGPQIKQMLDRLKIRSEFVDGLRVTDAATVEIVEMVLAGSINKQIVASIQAAGGKAVGISGKDARLLQVKKAEKRKIDPDSNIEKIIDLGFVGEPEKVDRSILDALKSSDIIPVIAPIAIGDDGQTYNVNADTAAGAIAAALNAKKLMMMTDVVGVLDQQGELISSISAADARKLIDEGVITGGMIPKIETCLKAVRDGVEAAYILDGRVPHGLVVELFTEGGVGTEITAFKSSG
jgi:acetylglutamate kinase